MSSSVAGAEGATPGAAQPPVLVLDHVSKHFRLQSGPLELKTALLHPGRVLLRRRNERSGFYAVRDVSFEVQKGEFFSIIGANGSGKSTLLRLMAGLSRPTSGSIVSTGRISTLLELGSGFHPQVTGRDNAIVNGLIVGMTRDQIEALLPSIISFAGLQEFIDQPMRTYSSGMYVRLGFAIAAHMDPEILLVDEVLAVGDKHFQDKCYAHIASLQARGVTIVMVSHDLDAVERFSTRAALMERGRIVAIGHAPDIVYRHVERLAETSPEIKAAIDEAIAADPTILERTLEQSPLAREEFYRKLAEQEEGEPATAEPPASADEEPSEE